MFDDWHNFSRALAILSDLYRRWILLELARRASSSSFIPSAIAAGLSPKSRLNLFLFFGFGPRPLLLDFPLCLDVRFSGEPVFAALDGQMAPP